MKQRYEISKPSQRHVREQAKKEIDSYVPLRFWGPALLLPVVAPIVALTIDGIGRGGQHNTVVVITSFITSLLLSEAIRVIYAWQQRR